MTRDPETPVVIPFPVVQSDRLKVRGPVRNLGFTPLSAALGPNARSARGHWCDHCEGIWYSYLPEVECPACGRRG